MKQKIVGIIILLLAFSLNGCKTSEDSSFGQAVTAIERADYSNAVVLADKAIEEGCNLKDAYRAKGIAYLGMADYVKAEVFLTNALHQSNGIVEDKDIDTSYYLAVVKYKSWDKQEARNILDAVIAIRPSSDMAYYMRGKLELESSDLQAALSDYDKAIEIAPGNYEYYIKICDDLKSAGYESEGDSYINKAMALDGKKSDAVKGCLEYYQGNYAGARVDLENAKKSQDSEMVELYLGRVYDALGDNDYALSLYQEAISKYPSNGNLYVQLALAKMSTGDYQGAIDTIDSGIENAGGSCLKSLMFNKAVAYERMYEFRKAYDSMKEYCDKYPDDEEAKRELIFLSSR